MKKPQEDIKTNLHFKSSTKAEWNAHLNPNPNMWNGK